MKAVVYDRYGEPEELYLTELPEPQISDQVSVGYFRNLWGERLEASVETYYKKMRNSIDFKDHALLLMKRFMEGDIRNGEGTSCGLEFLVRKNTGKLTGWVSYTLSRTTRVVPDINNGISYAAPYDKPHDFTIVANYHVNKRVSLSANFTYSTGRPITLPEYKFAVRDEFVAYFSDKNKYRIPDYHRLDLTLRIDESLRIKKKWKGSWSFSIMNLYGRKNAYTVYYKEETPAPHNDYNRFSLYKLYLIGRPIPTITYSFIF